MKKIIVLGLGLALGSMLKADKFSGKTCKVIAGPNRDQVAQIDGTSKEVWGIEDIWGTPRSFGIYAIMNYVFQAKNLTYGTVYYGKIGGLGFCFHESWLAELDDKQA
ncbi:MAG: hypothetical protein UR26_C0006G0059 [candidate division TM6 bacterium GW2011_GWF2_32_72]|nr:MAG: hypothetical protein UR26_C0006G0059 [candidate division TM6 bacterium GW2011_GWF2_32_72]